MAAWNVSWPWRLFKPKQVRGWLAAGSYHVPSIQAALGDFILRWEALPAGQLTVIHRDRPEKLVWSSQAGESFIAAGRGIERVTERRSLFRIQDHWEVICADQTVEQIETGSGFLRLSGLLSSRDRRTECPYTLTFAATGQGALEFRLEARGHGFNRAFLTYASDPEEHFFGFGEQFSYLDMKGRRLPVFVMEQGIGRGAQPVTLGVNLAAGIGGSWHTTYAGLPYYLTSRMRSLYLENSEYSVFDLRRPERVQIEAFSARLAGCILAGNSPAELISIFTERTGRMRPLPDWVISGAVVGMQGGTRRVREVYAELQRLGVPLAAFWLQDWVGQRRTSFGQQLWWNWELDRQRYPDWEELVMDLASAGVKIMVYINPFLADAAEKGNVSRDLYQEAAGKGYLVRNRSGAPYLIQNSSFSAALLDLTNPDAFRWYKEIIRENVIPTGALGWMADFGEGMPYDAQLASGEPAASYHNRYPVDWARLNREAVEEAGLGETAVFFTRAGYTGSARYSTLFWTGDQLVTWDAHDGIKTAVIALLSSGLSGFAFNHADIGGYTALRNPLRNYFRSEELLLRWMELCAFTVVYRTHEGNLPDENVQFYTNETTLAHFARFARVYAAWGFYRMELVHQAASTGLPVVRHPLIHYPEDPEVYKLTYQQFLLGSEIMVAPVLDRGRKVVRVYLPPGEWVHLWSDRIYGEPSRGFYALVPAPLGYPGVFYRSGSKVGAQFRQNLVQSGVLKAQLET